MRTLAVRMLGSSTGRCRRCRPVSSQSGIGVDSDLCGLPERDLGNVILIDITDDPDAGQIGDGKGRCRPREGHAGRGCDGNVLRNDDAGDRRIHIDHDADGWSLVDAERIELLLCGGQIGLDCPSRCPRPAPASPARWRRAHTRPWRAHRLYSLAAHRCGLQVGVKRIGDVRALHLHQQLALLHVVVEPSLDVDHAATGQRNDGNLASRYRD
jgi:hypothetical protein